MSSIATEHPQYIKFAQRWLKMNDALDDEDTVKDAGTSYLPRTGGMDKNDSDGKMYDAYRMRARFPEITTQALTGMVGLVFENDPVGMSEIVITNSGQNNVQLCRDILRGVSSKGRDILVIDAPESEKAGGQPFITRYNAESMINWKTEPDNPANLIMAVFREEVLDPDDEYGHETSTEYRKYSRVDNRVVVSRWKVVDREDVQIGDDVVLPVKFMPIIPVGSIDQTPACDPIPLLPVARCAFAYYRKSATYEHGLYLSMQPNPWVSGVNQEEYDNILLQGIGSNSLWYLGQEGRAGFLEVTAQGLSEIREAMQNELSQAETYAVRLTQTGNGVEAAASVAMRAATQHATIYSISDSVSISVDRAQEMLALWGGKPKPEPFSLLTEFTQEYAGESMIQALNSAINAGNAPRSALFEAIRRSGLSDKTDEEMQDEIDATGGISLLDVGVGAAPVEASTDPEESDAKVLEDTTTPALVD